MNNHFIKLASIVCIALLLIIIGEWLLARLAEQQLITASQVKAQTYQADAMPSIDLTEQAEDSYADLVERPLFIKGRRAVAEPPATAVQPVLLTGAAGNFDWQLNGVYTKDKRLFALFSHTKVKLPKAKDNYRKLSVGEVDDKGNVKTLEGWQVSEIKLDRVILKQGTEQKELLLRKPKPKELAKPVTSDAEPPAPAEEGAEDTPVEPEAEQPLPEPESEPTEAPQGDFENSNAHF